MIYEIKKVFGRRSVAVLLLALLMFGIGSCFFTENIEESEDYREKYSADTRRVIKTAKLNKNNLAEGSYLYKYQDAVIEKYSVLLNADIAPSAVAGYDDYILFGSKGVFLFIAAAMFGSILALTEQDSKMTALNTISKRGKHIYRNKAAVSCIAAVAVTVVFSLSQIAVFVFRFGAEGLFSPLVSIEFFKLCPYSLTVFEYLLFEIGALAVFACAISLISSLTGRFFGSYIVSIFAGLIPIGLYSLGEYDFNTLFARYHALNVGGSPTSLVNIIVVSVFLTLGGLISLMCFSPMRGSTSSIIVRIEHKVVSSVRGFANRLSKLLPKKKLGKRKPLFFYEIKKLSAASLVIVVLIIGTKCYIKFQPSQNTAYEDLYYNACTELSGELTDEKEAHIKSTLATAKEIISKKHDMREQMMEGKISHDEYEAYLESYYRAETDEYIYTRLETQVNHITDLRESGKDAYIVYETPWNKLLFAEYDLYLYLAVLLLLAGIFGVEQKHGMTETLKTTKNGVVKLTATKIMCALALTAILFACFTAIDLISVSSSYKLPDGSYPAISLISVSPSIKTNLIVYLILDLARKMFGYLALGGIVCIVSKLLKRVYFVMPVVLAITLLPHYLISDIPIWLDFLNFIS